MYIGGGRIVDWVGTRLGYVVFIVWWSLATLRHSFANSVAGLMGGVGSFGGMLFNLLIGAMLSGGGYYAPVFAIAGLLHPLSFLVVMTVIRRITPAVAADMAQSAG